MFLLPLIFFNFNLLSIVVLVLDENNQFHIKHYRDDRVDLMKQNSPWMFLKAVAYSYSKLKSFIICNSTKIPRAPNFLSDGITL